MTSNTRLAVVPIAVVQMLVFAVSEMAALDPGSQNLAVQVKFKSQEEDMFGNPSLMTRIAIGKGIGFVVGLAGFILLPYFLPEAGWLLRWGILFWYITIGAIIGVFGVITYHPVLKLPLPWWIRAPMLGAWMNFVLVFFAYDTMGAMMVRIFGEGGALSSPFWFAAEGAIIGCVIGYFATRFGGEGKATVGT